MKDRCGECLKCKNVERVRLRCLAACNPPFTHADSGVINVWNDALKTWPCTANTAKVYEAPKLERLGCVDELNGRRAEDA